MSVKGLHAISRMLIGKNAMDAEKGKDEIRRKGYGSRCKTNV